MQTWMRLEEFARIVQMSPQIVQNLIDEGKLASKIDDGGVFIEASSGTQIVRFQATDLVETESVDGSFVEKTLNTILSLHEKVVGAKDETLEALKRENEFLKEGLLSMQELQEKNQLTIDTLTKQVFILQEELEFSKRKYKLMWDQTMGKHQG